MMMADVSHETHETAPSMAGLAELYVRHSPAAVGLAYLLTGNHQLAEDLAQEAFVRLAGRFRHLRNQDRFEAYLRRTVVNLFLSHLRRVRLERAYLALEASRAGTAASGEPDVAMRDELWTALHRLPDRQRAAVVLRYYQDLSERDAAEAMRCSEAAVRSLVARGMETLRDLMRGEKR